MYFARSIRGLLVALLTAAAVAAFARTVRAQAPDVGIEIILHEGTELEERGRRQLLRLLSEYDLEPWIFTDTVLIRSRVVPHSHPVLTLNTRYLDDDLRQLSAFVHEQIHWFEAEHDAASDAAIEDLRRRYPEVPTGRPDGGRDEGSTYLHLIVCWLELDAMERLIGEERARELLAGKDYYRWIYARVLEDTEAIGDILAEHGLLIRPTAEPEADVSGPFGWREAGAAPRPRFIPYDRPPTLRNREEVRRLIREHAAAAADASGSAGAVQLWLYVDLDGHVRHALIKRSSQSRKVDRAALEVARAMRFEPAANRGEPTPVWVGQVIDFAEPGDRISGRRR